MIISPCLSLHFKGTVAWLCKLYRFVSILSKMSPIVFILLLPFFQKGVSLVMGFLVIAMEWNSCQLVGKQALWRTKAPPHSFMFCLMFVSPTLSTSCIPLALFFAFFQTNYNRLFKISSKKKICPRNVKLWWQKVVVLIFKNVSKQNLKNLQFVSMSVFWGWFLVLIPHIHHCLLI